MKKTADFQIWILAFGYFLCYWPYTALTKALSRGLLPGMNWPVGKYELLPLAAIGSLVGVIFFISLKGWWKYCNVRKYCGINIFWPNKWIFLSGICTAIAIASVIIAYTFDGVSIVFVSLLMIGGTLVTSPLVDLMSKRKVNWYSWVGLGLSNMSLIIIFFEKEGYIMTFPCAVVVIVHILSYILRLKFMSNLAKSDDETARIRFYVEERMVANSIFLLVLIILAFIGYGEPLLDIKNGFTEVPFTNFSYAILIIGLLSAGNGFFGTLILLDKRENTYCVSVNRSSNILAGIFASFSLMFLFSEKGPSLYQLTGSLFVLAAILFLAVPALLKLNKKC